MDLETVVRRQIDSNLQSPSFTAYARMLTQPLKCDMGEAGNLVHAVTALAIEEAAAAADLKRSSSVQVRTITVNAIADWFVDLTTTPANAISAIERRLEKSRVQATRRYLPDIQAIRHGLT